MVGVGDRAFYDNDSITSVTFKGDVADIGELSFGSCDNLTSVKFEGNVGNIGASAFSWERILTSVTFEGNVCNIGENAFCNSNLTSITFPGEVKNIDRYAFIYTNLTSVTFEGNVGNIGYAAFYGNDNLKSVTFKGNVTSIGVDAFRNNEGIENLIEYVILPQETIIRNSSFFTSTKVYFYKFDSDTYTGKPISLVVKDALANKELEKDKDYTAKGNEIKKPGEYTVVITLIGQYSGQTEIKHTIEPKALTISAASDTKACDGSALTKDSYTNTDLATGDRIESVTITGSQTKPGTSENVPSGAKIVNSAGEDVTSCYAFTYTNGTLTVEDHVFDQKVATITYFDEDADFTHAARYYYSCKCGEKGTNTFEAGEPLPTYTIIFDANGGSVNTASANTNAEYKLDSLPTPEYDGYNFLGWFTNETGGDEITTDTVFGANMTIYAHWEKKEEPKPAQGGTEKPEIPTEPSVPETPATPENPETPETPSEPETEDVKEETKTDYLDELYAMLREAIAKGEEQTINWSAGDSLPYDVMKILEENPQITLVFNYTYMGEDFNVTIRGRDVQADPKVKWCGPLYLYSIYGGYKGDENGLKESGTYIVQAGDTLSALATKFNTTIKNLVALNNIKDENLIFIGQELKY